MLKKILTFLWNKANTIANWFKVNKSFIRDINKLIRSV